VVGGTRFTKISLTTSILYSVFKKSGLHRFYPSWVWCMKKKKLDGFGSPTIYEHIFIYGRHHD
jgi:hypothetical protein